MTGPLVGNGGTLILGVELGGDASPSDRLLLDGVAAVASGNSRMLVENRGGLGAATSGDGIPLVVTQNGATTTATAFALGNAGGHVDAGAYQYRLFAGNAAGSGAGWYLRSAAAAPAPAPVPSPIAPAPTPAYREEAGLLSAIPQLMRQADLAMLSNLHRRMGDEDIKMQAASTGAITPAPVPAQRRGWARAIYSDVNVQQSGTVNPHTKGHLDGVQAGVDLFTSETGAWRAGLYVGSLDGGMNVDASAGGQYGRVGGIASSSRNLGAYATYLGQDGLYADAVLQYGRHSFNTTTLSSNASAGGKGTSYSASLEAGQSFRLNDSWRIEPQAQLIRQHVRVDDMAISGTTTVHQDAEDVWVGRLGVRIKGDVTSSAGKLQPYGRANLYRSSGGSDTASFATTAATTAITTRTGYTSGELAAGLTLKLSPTASFYGEVGKVFKLGSSGGAQVRSSVQGSVGLRVGF
ncbi:MAG: autotransporter outer membrane beta-barrel domain-containing protein [Microbacteriaceae bacterium]|nr:autotransporter outer membrane beta-barrel domain-containing protein [Burkholderiaceae bacterium]